MEINRFCTTVEQSKKLAEFLPIDSADMYYARIEDDDEMRDWTVYLSPMPKICATYVENLPCWSLAALLELIPKNYLIEANKKTTRTLYHITAISGEVTHYHQDLVDAAVEMLLKLYNKNNNTK